MLFNSYEFIFLFLPLVLAGYYLVFCKIGRTALLTLSSYTFYAWWDYRFCSLMIISTVVDYFAGKNIVRAQTQRRKKIWVAVSVTSNLTLLGFFKYWDLLAGTLNSASQTLFANTAEAFPVLGVVLPVGISFYTFQSMSYSMDIYRGQAQPAKSFLRFACYVALFPQLIAGPIVRYRDLAEQLNERTHSWAKAFHGATFFILGLGKKVILADGVAPLADAVFGQSQVGLIDSWIGITAYTLQIYFDFSGYSDMAVGLGLMFGFRFPINFNSPYKSTSITDFWRRWHISLSSWLRDYLYIPLGGNRLGPYRTYLNLFITMLLGGLWHGASWTFMFWGGYHGILLATERLFRTRPTPIQFPDPVKRICTLLLVMVGWVFFRAASFTDALVMLKGMCGLNGAGSLPIHAVSAAELPYLLLIGGLVGSQWLKNTWEMDLQKISFLRGFLLAALFLLCLMVIMVNTSSPFLYFQF